MAIPSGYFNGKTTIGMIVEKGSNNFDLLRLIAALSVVYSHAFPLFRHKSEEPVAQFLGFTTVGTLAVDLFFFLSGILVTASFMRSASIPIFIAKRVMRIWPGLVVCVLLTVFVAGPVLSSLSPGAYFRSPVTWHYLLANMVQYNFSYILPGVFAKNTYPDVVNGSLWTLTAEIRSYLFIIAVGVLQLFRRSMLFLVFSLLLCGSVLIKPGILIHLFQDKERVYFFLFFLAGVLVFLFREKIVLHPYIALLLVILWLTFRFFCPVLSQGLFYIVFMYVLLLAAQSRLALKLPLKNDYSYGIYIYGFLVQQCFAYYYPGMSSMVSLVYTLPVIVLLAILSWHCVERPALLLTHRKMRRSQ